LRPRISSAATLLQLKAEQAVHNDSPDLPIYLPATIQSDQNLVDLATFAKNNFRAIKKTGKKVGQEDPSLADDNLTRIPLLKSVDHKFAKSAVKLFVYVLGYGKGNPERPLPAFVEQLSATPELVDEVYIQVVRQTRQNANHEATVRMWDLLLVLATLFCASPLVQPVIRQSVASAAFCQDQALAARVQLVYLRFDGRCQIGAHVKGPSSAFIETIPSQVNECHFTLGASLFELMWQQRKTLPRCPVPIFMHRICNALIAQGAFEKEGGFKAVGNQLKVDRLCADIDVGRDRLEEAELAVLVTVFKKWLTVLPQPLVPVELYPVLLEQRDGKNYVAMAKELPIIYRDTLAYLIGFLKECVKSEQKTKMGLVTMATMFGMTVARPGDMNQSKVRDLFAVCKDFVIALLKEWDVSQTYPLKPELYQA
jgi:hypothetical protein